MHANSNEKFYPPMLNNSLSLEKEKMSELSSTQRIWRRGLVDEKKDGRRRWARGGGLIYGNSVARLKAHTAACCEQRGTGVGKNMDETRADPEEIFDLRFRARHEARTALAFAIVLQG